MIAPRRIDTRFGCQASGRRRSVLASLVCSDALLQLLQGELQLIRGELLRPAAELMPGQTLDQQAELVVLGVQFTLLE